VRSQTFSLDKELACSLLYRHTLSFSHPFLQSKWFASVCLWEDGKIIYDLHTIALSCHKSIVQASPGRGDSLLVAKAVRGRLKAGKADTLGVGN